jgi:cation diffusion facilitator family transporter
VIGHSPALLADGINSTSDVAYSLVVTVFVRIANKPADKEHPYGHSRLESIGAVVVGAFVITTAIAIFWNSVNTVYDLILGESSFAGGSLAALGAAVLTVLLKIMLSRYTGNVAEETENPSVGALASDHRNDVLSSLAAVIGIALGRLGYFWVDPLAGALVALIILKTGIEILRESTSDLMDTQPGESLRNQIKKLLDPLPEVLEIEEIHAHRFGPFLLVNITICIPGDLSVYQGDHIATRVENILRDGIQFIRNVHVHYHPADDGLERHGRG